MKRLLAILVCALALVPVFAQGSKEGSGFTESPLFKEPTSVNVAALKGPTAMGMVGLMEEAEKGPVNRNQYAFRLEAAPDAIVPLLAKGEVDIACIPANLAAVVYNNTDKIQVLGINTLGVLYICQNGGEDIESAEDLRGKTIYSAGKGSTPQYALETVLAGYNLEVGKDVFIEWKSEHAECVAALAQNGKDGKAVAMLPQPFATTAMIQNGDIKIALDLNDLWSDLSGTALVTGVTVATKSFIAENRAAVDQFLKDYNRSVELVNSDIDQASSLIEKFGIIKAAVAKKALPYCQIVLITGDELKASLDVYLNALYAQNPKSVGGKVPGDAFYL